MPRGGKREGAGRKPASESGAGSPTTVWLNPDDRAALAALQEAGGMSMADVMRLGIKAAEARARRRQKK